LKIFLILLDTFIKTLKAIPASSKSRRGKEKFSPSSSRCHFASVFDEEGLLGPLWPLIDEESFGCHEQERFFIKTVYFASFPRKQQHDHQQQQQQLIIGRARIWK
jgi:hypothetical protein